MSPYHKLLTKLPLQPKVWLITGVCGFIGSNLLEALLKLNQRVIGMDNFATGFQHNLDDVKNSVSPKEWANFKFIEGDIRELADCHRACKGVDYVLHQAALGSVPRSLADPITTNSVNISGFLNMLISARDASVKSFTYAASSSAYGDHPALPKVEDLIGNPLSPYAVTKYVNELYADVFSKCYGFNTIGLRYFNVYGPRQTPYGAYAAVIPKWISSLLKGETVVINGDGESSRDFTFVENAIQANLLAATIANWPSSGKHIQINSLALNQIYNIAVGKSISLTQLFYLIRDNLMVHGIYPNVEPEYRDFRIGDIRHSLADISKAKRLLGYKPLHFMASGIQATTRWYIKNLRGAKEAPI